MCLPLSRRRELAGTDMCLVVALPIALGVAETLPRLGVAICETSHERRLLCRGVIVLLRLRAGFDLELATRGVFLPLTVFYFALLPRGVVVCVFLPVIFSCLGVALRDAFFSSNLERRNEFSSFSFSNSSAKTRSRLRSPLLCWDL